MRFARAGCSLFAALLLNASTSAADTGACVVDAARAQVGVTTIYDPEYRRIAYPNGDVPRERGVCTDVIVRTYRAYGVDLQRLVHEDMRSAWQTYPKLWALSAPDTNIDHRRVPNLGTFFARQGQSLPVTTAARDYIAGDIVTWRLTSGVPHIGVVSNRVSRSGVPLVIHNIGAGTVEEDMLFSFAITGHYRYSPQGFVRACETQRVVP